MNIIEIMKFIGFSYKSSHIGGLVDWIYEDYSIRIANLFISNNGIRICEYNLYHHDKLLFSYNNRISDENIIVKLKEIFPHNFRKEKIKNLLSL